MDTPHIIVTACGVENRSDGPHLRLILDLPRKDEIPVTKDEEGNVVEIKHFEADNHLLTFVDEVRMQRYDVNTPQDLFEKVMLEHVHQHYQLGDPSEGFRDGLVVSYADGVQETIQRVLTEYFVKQ